MYIEEFISKFKIYDKRHDYDFGILNFLLLDGVIPCRLIRFARACSHVTDFNARNKNFTSQISTAGLSI